MYSCFEDYCFLEKDGRYYVRLENSGKEEEVSKEIYDYMKRSEEREKKRYQRRYLSEDGDLSLDYEYEEKETFKDFLVDLSMETPEEYCIHMEERYFLEKCILENCSASDRNLLKVLFGEELTEQAYADSLGIPRSTINSRKHSLFKRLRKKLKDF